MGYKKYPYERIILKIFQGRQKSYNNPIIAILKFTFSWQILLKKSLITVICDF